MKITCLSNVSDKIKDLVQKRLGTASPVKLQTLIDLTEMFCIEHDIDTTEHQDHIDEIVDYIVDYLDVNEDQDALATNLELGLLVPEDLYDKFYEQNQMFLNTEIEASPENMAIASSAMEVHRFAKVIDLENGNIYISFPEATFGDVYVSPRKLTRQERKQGYTQEMKQIKVAAIENGTFMKAPNGEPTNLENEKQWLQVRTKAFKEWFGDWENDPTNASKVIDENGEPLVVYHGSKAQFDTFITQDRGDNEAFFSSDENYAKQYGTNVYPVFLNIKNPDYYFDDNPEYKNSILGEAPGISHGAGNFALAKGHDGIIGHDIVEDDTFTMQYGGFFGPSENSIKPSKGIEYVVTNPNQIKSATDNDGGFRKEENRIDRFTDNTDYYSEEQLQQMPEIDTEEFGISFNKEGDIRETVNEFKNNVKEQSRKYNESHHFDGGVKSNPRQNLNGFTEEQNASYNNFIRMLSNGIMRKLESLGYKINISQNDSLLSPMAVSTSDGIVNLYYNPRLLAMDNQRVDYIMAHELVHTVTSQAVNNVMDGTASEEEQQFVNDIWDIIKDLNNNKNFFWDFGFDMNNNSDRARYVKEFIANVMTNPNLQRELANIKTNEKQSFWSKIVSLFKNLVSKFLGKNINGTYLEKTMNTIGVHIENFTGGNDANVSALIEGQQQQTKFTRSEGGYQQRTKENADWSDITVAFATDFSTPGEKRTKNVAGNKYFRVEFVDGIKSDMLQLDDVVEKAKEFGRPIKLNIAGNGIYTLGVDQEVVNREITNAVKYLLDHGVEIEEIRSGGQTGVDEAGIIAAQRLGIKSSVVAPSKFEFRVPKYIFDSKYKSRVKTGEYKRKANGSYDIIGRQDLFEERFQQSPKTQPTQQPKQSKSKTTETLTPKQKLDKYVQEYYDMMDQLGKKVVKDENFEKNHTYWVYDENGKKHKAYSVTQYIHGKKPGEAEEETPWFSIGNSFDKFVRDYFDGGIKKTYKNLNTRIKNNIIKALKYFEAALKQDERFKDGYQIITKEFPIGAKVGKRYIAGTMDMVIIDTKGNIYPVDMKTFSNIETFNKSASQDYVAQVSTYSDILRANIIEDSGLNVSDQQALLTAQVTYPRINGDVAASASNFVSEDGRVYFERSKGEYVLLSDYNDFDISVKHDGNLIKGFLKQIEYKKFKGELEGLTEQEKEDYKEMPDGEYEPIQPDEPESEQDTEDDTEGEPMINQNPAIVFGNLNPVPDIDMVIIARDTVKQIIMYCDMLKKDTYAQLASEFLDDQDIEIDEYGKWKNIPKDITDIISKPGIYRRMFERIILNNYQDVTSDYDRWLRMHINHLIDISFGELKKLTGAHIEMDGSVIVDSQETEDINQLHDQIQDQIETNLDNYDIDKRTQMLKEHMPVALKRKLFVLPKYLYDSYGNKQYDEYWNPYFDDGTGNASEQPNFVDENDVVQTLARNLHGIKKFSEMKLRMEQLAEDVPWLNEVLEMLDENSPDYDKAAADVFFRTFRKAQTLYTNIFSVSEWVKDDAKQDDEIQDSENGNIGKKSKKKSQKKKKGRKITRYVIQPTNVSRNSQYILAETFNNIISGNSSSMFSKHGSDMHTVEVDDRMFDGFSQVIADIKRYVDGKVKYNRNEVGDLVVQALGYLGFQLDDTQTLKQLIVKTYYRGQKKGSIPVDTFLTKLNSIRSLLRSTNTISLNDSRIQTPMKSIADSIAASFDQRIENTQRDGDKTFMTFTESSPLQDLVDNISGEDIWDESEKESYRIGNSNGIFDDENHRFNRFRQFSRIDKNNNRVYISSWLNKLSSRDGAYLRSKIRHYVHTSTDGKQYFKQNDDQYTLSLLLGYFMPSTMEAFDTDGSNVMLCRVPVISDKNSQEWIMFEKESTIQEGDVEKFKNDIADSAQEFFFFEVQRMMSVLKQLRSGDPSKDIKNYNLDRDKAAALASGKITREMLMDGDHLAKWVMNSGFSFRYLPMLNHEIEKNTKFGKALIKLLNSSEKDIAKNIEKLDFREAFKRGMDEAFEVFKDSLSENTIDILRNSTNMSQDMVDQNLLEYFYNDFIATANIMNLTFADPAFFKDTIDIQKRFAQYHSQTQKVNTEATIPGTNGKKFSDGKFRFVVVDSLILSKKNGNESPLVNVVKDVFTRLENEAKVNGKETAKSREMKLLAHTIPHFFEKVDVTDGQAYHSITSMWKKLNLLGSCDTDMDNFYKAVKGIGEGDFSLRNFNVVLQSMKPVATGFVEKSNDSNLASGDHKIVVPTYIKDSESLIFLAGAILHGANSNHVLAAMHDFMENSHYGFNSEHNLDTYSGDGIDTICFDSAVKNGVSNVIDLNGCKTYDEVYKKLESTCRKNGQNTEYIQEMEYDGWGIQQNVPEHMQDHEQDLGSQTKVLGLTDLSDDDFSAQNGTPVTVNRTDKYGTIKGIKTYNSKKQFTKDYFDLVDKEFKQGFKELDELFGIKFSGGRISVNKAKFNQAISNMSVNKIIQDQKYSIELLNAVRFLDSNSDFIAAIGDPQIADTIFGTVFTQIKNLVNKQQVPGGPVVQMSAFGLNDDLKIKNENGVAYGEEGFDALKGLVYEVYITAPTEEIERKITYRQGKKYRGMTGHTKYKDGDIITMEDIMACKLLSKDELRLIGYRIPTEDKYSIFRMEIKGFLSRRAGEIIIMPSEITALSGTDFDIDKMYCWFKKYGHIGDDYIDELSDTDVIHNDMFEMQWTSLGLRSSVIHQLDPGNYELLGDIADEVYVDDGNDDSLLYVHNQVKIKKDNQAGKNFVGISALNNTCHGISSMCDIKMRIPEGFNFNIDGKTVDDISEQDENGRYVILDSIYSKFNDKRISKQLSMFVGASADNAKYGYLGKLNTNPTTATIVMGMIRLGIPVRTVCYMMKTPVVQRMIDEAERDGKRFEKIISQTFASMKKAHEINEKNAMSYKIEGYEPDENNKDGGNMYRYIHGKLGAMERRELEGAIVTFLNNIQPYCSDIANLNGLLSLNSTKNGVGPTIYDVLEKWSKLSGLIYNIQHGFTRFDADTIQNIEDNVPYIMTLKQCYDEYAIGICSKISPVCGPEFMRFLESMHNFDTSGNFFNEDNMKRLINAYLLYRASKLKVFNTDYESRKKLLYDTPTEFFSTQHRFVGNMLLSSIQANEKMNRKVAIPDLKLDMSKLNKDSVDLLQASWTQLTSIDQNTSEGEELVNWSKRLIDYFSHRFGFMWQPNSAMNVVPGSAKSNRMILGYESIFNPSDTQGWNMFDEMRLLDQFARNNPDCGLWTNLENGPTMHNDNLCVPIEIFSDRTFGYKFKNRLFVVSNPKIPRIITDRDRQYVVVKEVKRLGIDKNFLEYDAYNDDIESVVTAENTYSSSSKYRKLYNELTSIKLEEDKRFMEEYGYEEEEDEYNEGFESTQPDSPTSEPSGPIRAETQEEAANAVMQIMKDNVSWLNNVLNDVDIKDYDSAEKIIQDAQGDLVLYSALLDAMDSVSNAKKRNILQEMIDKYRDMC